ncbi:hypothetical protein AB0D00_26540 [Streptomyces sp. NPDC048213]|uniref:hypothetical protein n=1 Tax=Streptomyces sp. NPDC048213 TaxID=3160984 RepID=UPI0033C9CDB7
MPLNVPVTLTTPPIDRRYTVHTDRQCWSAEQLAAGPDGRAVQEAAVREGVRKAAPACAYAQLTEPDIAVAETPDGSVTMTGRVLCDEGDCYTAAQRHRFDAVESAEAAAAADWVAQKEFGRAPGELVVIQERGLKDEDRRQRRATRGFMLAGLYCVAVGVGMARYDYHRPKVVSGDSFTVLLGESLEAVFTHLASPLVVAGALIALYGIVRNVTTK